MLISMLMKAKIEKKENNKIIYERLSLRLAFSLMLINVFLLAEVVLTKTYMLRHSGAYDSLYDVIRISGPDIAFILIASFCLIIFSCFLKARFHSFLRIFYILFAYIFSVSLFAQSVLFKITGFGILREYIWNFFHNPAEDLKLVMSEAKWFYIFGLMLLLFLIFFLAKIPYTCYSKKLNQKIQIKSEYQLKKVGLIVLAVSFIILEGMALVPRLEGVHPAIRQVPMIELLKCFLPEKRTKDKNEIIIPDEQRLDNPIILEPGENFKPFNVVLIIFESLSWKYCDIYNPGFGATPYLAELAKRSLVVERLYTVDPHTTKALIPIIAGIYPYPEPEVIEARPGILPPKALPHILKKLGYRTAFFQTANNYEDRPAVVSNLGYETFRGLYHMSQEGFAYVNYFGREEMMMLKPSLEWVDENQEMPFFLTYLTLSAHHEYGYPPSFPAKDFKVNNERKNRYLNAIRYIDYFISQVIKEYDKRNLLKKTIFIIVGDHGEAFDEHGLSGHNYTLWEEGLRVPGIIYAPGIISKPGTIEGFRSLLDIVPTICDLLGLKITEGKFVGRSLLTPPDDSREFFYTGWTMRRVIGYRKGGYKYLFYDWRLNPEIYNNLVDPYDKNELFKLNEEFILSANEYEIRVKRLWESVAAQYCVWEKNSSPTLKSNKPEEFAISLEAIIEDLIKIYGYGYFPDKTESNRTIYIHIGLKCENKVKRPLQIRAILFSEEANKAQMFNLRPRISLEKLSPGEFTTADTIMAIPSDWPFGQSKLYIGVLDEKRNTYINPGGSGFEASKDGLIFLGYVSVLSPKD